MRSHPLSSRTTLGSINDFDCFLHIDVAPFTKLFNGSLHRYGRLNADEMMLASVMFQYSHSCPSNINAARQIHIVNVPVYACRRFSDDFS